MLKTLQNFYKAVVTTGLDTGTGTCYVSVLPTPSAGYLVINPSNVTKREIVAYSGTGTDEGGSYVTLTTRGVGGTTEQAHDVNEPVRMNLTAEYYAEVQDEVDDLQGQIDTLVLQNAPNASTTTRGIVLMSTAPAEAGTSIVVSTNDPRVNRTNDPSGFVSVSTGSANAGSGVVLNSSGILDTTITHRAIKRQYDIADSPATWTKPTGLTYIDVELWGGGGSGGSSTSTFSASGGGGGAYIKGTFLADKLGAIETITIGAGGIAVSGGGTNGNDGGNSTFGSLLTIYGGENGAGNTGAGGGGGGVLGRGSSETGGAPLAGTVSTFGGGNGATGSTGGTSIYGGAGGADDGNSGGSSVYGGGGGGGGQGGSGGTSTFGGNGGAGANSGTATSGSVPGGGGGGVRNSGTSGAGAAGRCIITEYYS